MVGLEVFIPFDIDIITTDFNALKEKEHVNIYNDNNTEGVAAATSEGEMDKVTAETPDGKVRAAALLAMPPPPHGQRILVAIYCSSYRFPTFPSVTDVT